MGEVTAEVKVWILLYPVTVTVELGIDICSYLGKFGQEIHRILIGIIPVIHFTDSTVEFPVEKGFPVH